MKALRLFASLRPGNGNNDTQRLPRSLPETANKVAHVEVLEAEVTYIEQDQRLEIATDLCLALGWMREQKDMRKWGVAHAPICTIHVLSSFMLVSIIDGNNNLGHKDRPFHPHRAIAH